MKPAPNADVERYRVLNGPMGSTIQNGNNGMFLLPLRAKLVIFVVVSDGRGWDHVSVSLKRPLGRGKGFKEADRCPTWEEMCQVKDWFFKPDELAIQYHPRSTEYRNLHPHTLHIWRPNGRNRGSPKKLAADIVQRLADSEPTDNSIEGMERLRGTPQESMFVVDAAELERVIETGLEDAIYDAAAIPEPDPDFVAPRPGETEKECIERRRDLR